MSTEVKLPDLGENIAGGDILSIHVKVGDTVSPNDTLLEVETDKATLEVPCPVAGTIEKILIQEKGKVQVGQAIFLIQESNTPSASTAKATSSTGTSNTEPQQAPAPKETPKAPSADNVASPQVSSPTSSQVIEIHLPELGEGVHEGGVISVLVQEGQTIEENQSILEVETDKATLEVPSTAAGRVKKLQVSTGQKIKVGEVILTLETTVSQGTHPTTPQVAEPAPAKSPSVQTNNSEAVTPSKSITSSPASVPGSTSTASSAIGANSPKRSRTPIPAAPSVRRFAFEIGIDIYEVKGTGPGGRISIEDVKKHSKQLNSLPRSIGGSTGSPVQLSLPDFSVFGKVKLDPMNKIREVTARHMSNCWAMIPHVTHHDKANIGETEKLRLRFKAEVLEKGGKLTLTSMLIKILSRALEKFPKFNASIDPLNNQVIYKEYVNIGIAVDTPQGLMVPVIRNANKKTITELSIELNTLSEKAKSRKITPSDLSGGCMSITNLGGIGGQNFTPIVNWPEVAILGIMKSEWEPVWNGTQFIPTLRVPLSLSYDHRLIDGADAARFLNYICDSLADAFTLAREL